MQLLSYITKKKTQQQIEPIQFAPSIQINPNSTLFVQVMPNNPHTASDIVVNTYQSKTNRTILQTRIQWKRFKILTETQHTNTNLPFITGNAYRCQPSDLGYYIQAKITSYDVACNGSAEVTIGPIRLDPTVKRLIQDALYYRQLKSQVKIYDKLQNREADMVLTDRFIRLTEKMSNQKIQMPYDMFQPKIQVNPKDPTKIFLRFQKEENQKLKTWQESIFGVQDKFDTQSKKSYTSNGSDTSKNNKIFKEKNRPVKIQIQFLTRSCRDQFIFSLRAFIYKQSMKNTAVLDSIQTVIQMKSPADAHKFFQFMSLNNQIYRLAQMASQLEEDRNKKLKDLYELQETVASMTTNYMELIQKNARQLNMDINKSYSEVSIRRDEILGKRQIRQLVTENQQLKNRVRQLNQDLQLKQFFSKKNNQSMLFNQTSNPFAKKDSNDSYYNPSMANQKQQQMPKPNVVQLTKSYLNLVKENQKLKEQKRAFMSNSNNQSLSKDDMVNLLQSLHQEDEDPAVLVKKLKTENKILKKRLQEYLSSEAANKIRAQSRIRLNQSVAYQQQQPQQQNSMITDKITEKKDKSNLLIPNKQQSFVSKQESSFYSVSNQSKINEQMNQSAVMLMLQKKVQQINKMNVKTVAENDRLRKQRNQYKSLYQQIKKGGNPNIQNNSIDHKSVFSNSNYFDPEGLKQQNQNLINQKNNLLKKIESLTRQTGKNTDGFIIQKKCQQLTKQNNYLKQQNQSLKQKLSSIKQSSKSPENSFTQNYRQNQKLKKINSQLLQQIKKLKLEIQEGSDPLNTTKYLQLQNEVDYLKKVGQSSQSSQKATQQLINQVSKLQKQVQRLERQNKDKDAKLASQAIVIERLMSQQQNSHSISGKDKSYSQTRNDSESNQKLKKKIKQLQQQIVLMRRSADALNRSQDISRDMMSYNEEQMDVMRRQKQIILGQNEKLSKMCQRYAKDARQAMKQVNKWKQQALDLMKAQNPQDASLSIS